MLSCNYSLYILDTKLFSELEFATLSPTLRVAVSFSWCHLKYQSRNFHNILHIHMYVIVCVYCYTKKRLPNPSHDYFNVMHLFCMSFIHEAATWRSFNPFWLRSCACSELESQVHSNCQAHLLASVLTNLVCVFSPCIDLSRWMFCISFTKRYNYQMKYSMSIATLWLMVPFSSAVFLLIFFPLLLSITNGWLYKSPTIIFYLFLLSVVSIWPHEFWSSVLGALTEDSGILLENWFRHYVIFFFSNPW